MAGGRRRRCIGLVVTAAMAMAAGCSSSSPPAAGPASNGSGSGGLGSSPTTTALDPRVIAVIEVGSAPTGIAFGFGRVWVSNHHSNSVSIIDPATNEVTDEIPFEAQPHAITIGEDYVLVATTKADGTMVRIDPDTLELTEFVPGESDIACAPAVAYGYVYASQPGFSPGVAFISKSSETTHKLVTKIQVGDGFTCGIVAAGGSIWAAVSDGPSHQLWRIDKSSAEVAQKIDLPCGSTMWAQSFAFGSLWTADFPGDGTHVCRVDPKTGTLIANIDAAAGVVATGAGGVWIADPVGKRLVRIDPDTNEVDLEIPLPVGEGHMWVEGSDIWYSSFEKNEVWRIRP